MKGLLIKDFKLMKGQKNFFILVIMIALFLAIFTENTSFLIGYLTFISASFTLSSISYDEFDNGNAFLFSLPITRKSYVLEKYSFSLILGGGSWLFASVMAISTEWLKQGSFSFDIVMSSIMVLPLMFLMLAVMLPLIFKFGGEKGRAALVGMVGLLVVIFFFLKSLFKIIKIDLTVITNAFSTLSWGLMMTVIIGITLVLFLFSYKISEKIIVKKEF